MRYTPKLPFVSESEHGDKPLDFGETYFQNNMASGSAKPGQQEVQPILHG